MRTLNRIIIHCAATPPDMDIGVAEIRKWHTDKGWSDIGYHWVITRGGQIEAGRPVEIPGAHAKGHNQDSIGICMVGGVDADNKPDSNFTRKQWAALDDLVARLHGEYGYLEVFGHRDYSTKACPSFDARAWAA